MRRIPIHLNLEEIPAAFHPFLRGATLYDSSCSPAARVVYLEREGGFYLKSSAKGSLAKEAAMTRFFHEKGLGPEVLRYESGEKDWLLTARVAGEDCTHRDYLADPKRLCDTLAERLRALHELDGRGCPVPDHTASYLALAQENYRAGMFDPSYFESEQGITAEEAWRTVQAGRHLLVSDTLLHGDYCLPNVVLDQWSFSGFIDLGNGGLGDRHVDLFWGVWSLRYNLKTDQYRQRFFEVYGKDRVDEERLRIIAAIETFG